MRKSAARKAGNAELISTLCYAHVGERITKTDRETVRVILEELSARGVITAEESGEMVERFNRIGYC